MTAAKGNLSRAVLFDLDGTLIDSFPGIAAAYHHLLTTMDLGDIDDTEIEQFIGPPIQEVLQHHFGLKDNRLAEGIALFRQHYGTRGIRQFTKYQGIDHLLDHLLSDGYALAVATSKLTTMAAEIIEHAGWAESFDVIGGALPDGSRHLKPDVVKWTIGQFPAEVRVVAMIGDRAADIIGGRSQGVPGIGVSWGYGDESELVEASAVTVVDVPSAIPGVLRLLG